MYRPSYGRRSQWRTALGVSVVLHVAFLIVVKQSKWPTPSIESPSTPVVVWLSDWLRPQTSAEEPTERIPEGDENNKEEPELAESESATITQPPETIVLLPAPTESPQAVRRSVDWAEEARRAIARMRVEEDRANTYITFSFPRIPEESGSTGAYERGGLRQRSGDRDVLRERDVFGDIRMPLGNGCYQTVGSGSIILQDLSRFMNPMTMCVSSVPAKPRNDLFSEQKPEYFRWTTYEAFVASAE